MDSRKEKSRTSSFFQTGYEPNVPLHARTPVWKKMILRYFSRVPSDEDSRLEKISTSIFFRGVPIDVDSRLGKISEFDFFPNNVCLPLPFLRRISHCLHSYLNKQQRSVRYRPKILVTLCYRKKQPTFQEQIQMNDDDEDVTCRRGNPWT